MIKLGDVVVRKSYGGDIIFRVKAIVKNEAGKMTAVLKGLDLRLEADAPLDDLEPVMELNYLRFKNDNRENNSGKVKDILAQRRVGRTKGCWRVNALTSSEGQEFFDVPGEVLHIDGDEEYLSKCLDAYRKLKIPHNGFSIPEKEQPNVVLYYLQKYHPDILVITGHDGLLKDTKDFKNIDSYRNSRHFVAAVKEARKYLPSLDDLVIFAGACQSHYEELLAAGANFASSPRRVFIHIFDPVFVVEKIAFTSIKDTLTLTEISANTITGAEGVGGVETRGRFRLGYPKSPY